MNNEPEPAVEDRPLTVADLDNLPKGTIVDRDGSAYRKRGDRLWVDDEFGGVLTAAEMVADDTPVYPFDPEEVRADQLENAEAGGSRSRKAWMYDLAPDEPEVCARCGDALLWVGPCTTCGYDDEDE